MSDSRNVLSWLCRIGQFIYRSKWQHTRGWLKIILVVAVLALPTVAGATTVSSTVPVGGWPRYIAVNPSNNKVYVVNNSEGSVTIINGETHAPITTLTVGDYPSAISLNTSTNTIYVASVESQGYGTVSVIDGSTDSVITTVTVGFFPTALAVNPLTNKIYVANYYSNSVTVIDAANGYHTSTVDVGFSPVALVVNPGTNMVYVANSVTDGTVTMINTANNNSTSTVAVGSKPVAVALNLATGKVYVANLDSNTVTVIDPANSNNTVNVAVGSNPLAIAINHTTNKIYVINQGDGSSNSTISIIDGTTDMADTPAISVGVLAYEVAVNQGTNKVYVANRGNDTVTMFDAATSIPTTLSAPSGQVWDAPRAIAVNQETNKVFVANEISGNVTVIQNYYSVTVTSAGSGTGTVTSAPAAIICGSTCSTSFPEGTAVVLFQAPDTSSGFAGWGGAICSGTADCAFSVMSDSIVSADFTQSPLVKNQTSGVAYSTLQAACDEATDGNTISARNDLTPASLNITTAISLNLEGGFDSSYAACIGLTTILGRLDVRLAPLRVRGLAIR